MNKTALMAGSLFLCSIAIIIGLIWNNSTYWYTVDIIVILLCSINGWLILKNKT